MFQFLQSNRVTSIVMFLLLVVLGVAMLFFGNVSSVNPSLQDKENIAQIDGAVITRSDFNQTYQSLFAFYSLQAGRVLDDTPRMQRELEGMSWRWLLMLHGAEELGVLVANKEVSQRIMQTPVFQRNGKFSSELYGQYLQVVYSKYGLTEAGFEKLVREMIAVERFQEALVAPVQVADAQVDEIFAQVYSPVTMKVVVFPLEPHLKAADVTPAQIEQRYNENLSADPELRTPEKRQVSFVSFDLKPEDRKLPPGDRARVLNALQSEALRFYTALLPGDGKMGDFNEVAKEQQLQVRQSGDITLDGPVKGVDKTNAPAFANAAYNLSPERPLGRVQLTAKDAEGKPYPVGFIIMKLDSISDTEPLPLEKVKGLLSERLKNENADMALFEHAGLTVSELNEMLKSGKSFEEATKELKLSVTQMPPFVPGAPVNPEAAKDPKMRMLREVAAQMETGDISRLLPMPDDKALMVAYLAERGDPENETFGAQRGRIRAQLRMEAQEAVLQEWIRLQMDNPKTVAPAMLKPEEPTSTGLEG